MRSDNARSFRTPRTIKSFMDETTRAKLIKILIIFLYESLFISDLIFRMSGWDVISNGLVIIFKSLASSMVNLQL